jgi:hypothetical protein
MRRKTRTRSSVLRLELLESRLVLSGSVGVTEAFDGSVVGGLPAGWSQYSSTGAQAFAVSADRSLSPDHSLSASSPTTSGLSARAWVQGQQSADVRVGASVYVDSLIPARVLARGSGLDTNGPSYYAASLTRGLQVQLLAVVGGQAAVLGQVRSASWFEAKWARVVLQASGSTLSVQVERIDDGRFLNASGQWQASPAWALTATDSSVPAGGLVGLDRPASYTGSLYFDDFRAESPLNESFDTTAVGKVPQDWSQYSSTGVPAFAVSADRSLSPDHSLAVNSPTTATLSARAWVDGGRSDVRVGASVYVDSLIPARVLARGSGLDTGSPSYYAASLTRGLQVQLLAVVGGQAAVLGQVRSASWFEAKWARVVLQASGSTLRVQVERLDDGRFLDPSGQWLTSPTWAITVTDSSITSGTLVGLDRPASYTGSLYFDDFRAEDGSPDLEAPSVTILSPAASATLSGTVKVQAAATDNVGVSRLEYLVDGVLRFWLAAPSASWDFDTTTASDGTHVLTVLAYDDAGNVGRASVTFQTQNAVTPPALPDVPRHYTHIRLAELAYGTIGSFEQQLLKSSIDLVVVDSPVLDRPAQIQAVAPDTPQLLYSNLSNIFGGSLTDWLQYADSRGISRESAFYHAAQPTAFSGAGASTQPVNWFWNVYKQGSQTTDLTSTAHGGVIIFPAAGETLGVGYDERFREVNLNLSRGASGGWSGVLEYVSAVDAAGNPTAWRTLTTVSDATAGFTRSGQITFNPPANWVQATIAGQRLYYVRVRGLTNGAPPIALSILGRDYVGANGGTSGTIPAFDSSADTNHDGYLDDAEFARRAPGKNARFVYESRLFTYGQMRFTTNPSDPAFRAWATDYLKRSLNAQSLMDGLFIDNSSALPPAGATVEATASYAGDYASLVGAVGKAIAPRWVMVNTAGGNATTDATVKQAQAYFEEFSIRPMAHNYVQFEQLAATVARRAALTSPPAYAVLDSNPQGGAVGDPRLQIATLAYYYLLGDPNRTFLDVNGGSSPGSSWTQHWDPAAAYDVGQPVGTWSEFAAGTDPASPSLSYRIYQRQYTNALVLYKPLSFSNNVTGTLSDATATTHQLDGAYYVLRADGTLGAKVTSVTLRNGEGAILIKA